MKLDDFDTKIPEMIVDFGCDYFESEAVLSLDEIEPNVYIAEVEGDEVYEVQVELASDGEILWSTCDCSFDDEPHCEHEVAVFFALEEMLFGYGALKKSFGEEEKKILQKDLNNLKKEELVALIIKFSERYETIRDELPLFMVKDLDASAIHNIIDSYMGKATDFLGMIPDELLSEAVKGGQIIMKHVREAIEKKRFLYAAKTMVTMIRHFADNMIAVDESRFDSPFDMLITLSFSLLEDMGDEEIGEEDRKALLELFMTESQSKIYQNWSGWVIHYVDVCMEVAKTQELKRSFDAYLSGVISSFSGSDDRVKLAYGEMFLLKQYEIRESFDPAAAEELLQDHMDCAVLVQPVVTSAMSAGDYQRVLDLTDTVIPRYPKDVYCRPLLLDSRFEAAVKMKNLKALEEVGALLIAEGDFSYYHKLKKVCSSEDWQQILPQVLETVKDSGSYYNYPKLLAAEELYDELLEHVSDNLQLLQRYTEELLFVDHEAIYQLYEKQILEQAKESRTRKDYRNIAGLMRVLRNYGGTENADRIRIELLRTYPKRRAMHDELSKA